MKDEPLPKIIVRLKSSSFCTNRGDDIAKEYDATPCVVRYSLMKSGVKMRQQGIPKGTIRDGKTLTALGLGIL